MIAIIGQSIDILASSIEGLISAIKILKAWRKDDNNEEVKRLMLEREQMSKDFEARMKKRWSTTWEGMKEGFLKVVAPEERKTKPVEVPIKPTIQKRNEAPMKPIVIPERIKESKETQTRETKESKEKIIEREKKITLNPVKTFKKTETKNIKVEAKIDMGRTEININSEGEAEKIGKEFASNMSQELNKQLRKMLQDSNLGVASA